MASSERKKKIADDDKSRVSRYLASLPPDSRRVMKTLRTTIKSAAAGAVDAFSYGIPAFRLDGRVVVYYAAWKTHCSMYPISAAFARSHGIDASAYKLSKGTIQFPLARALPVALVKKLVKARVAALREGGRRSG